MEFKIAKKKIAPIITIQNISTTKLNNTSQYSLIFETMRYYEKSFYFCIIIITVNKDQSHDYTIPN